MKIIFSKNVRLALWLLALPLLGVFSQAQAQTSSAPFGPITYLHNDVTGNVMLATNSSGAIVWEERYLPYGAKRLGAAGGVGGVTSSGQRYGYHNKSLDPETGLQYFGGRYYDPLTGRFSAMDPAPSGNPDIYAFNRYSFANGNPYTFTDPNGRNVFSIVDWGTFAHDVGGLLVTEIVYTAAVLQGNNAVASMAIEEMASQRADAAFSTVGIISPVPKTGGILKAAMRFEEEGGGKLAARGATVIGKVADLKTIAAGERTLLERLPKDLGSPRANWYQNSSVLRQEMSLGQPIRDATVDGFGRLINNTGFLRAERNLLETHGWTFDSPTTLWMPPVP